MSSKPTRTTADQASTKTDTEQVRPHTPMMQQYLSIKAEHPHERLPQCSLHCGAGRYGNAGTDWQARQDRYRGRRVQWRQSSIGLCAGSDHDRRRREKARAGQERRSGDVRTANPRSRKTGEKAGEERTVPVKGMEEQRAVIEEEMRHPFVTRLVEDVVNDQHKQGIPDL